MDISRVASFGAAAQVGNKNQNRQILPGQSGAEGESAAVSGKKQFMDYMKQTPAERMQSAWLAQRGISKEQFDAMGPEEKQKLLAQMREEIEKRIKDGVASNQVDVLA
jgi:hypothetical protein